MKTRSQFSAINSTVYYSFNRTKKYGERAEKAFNIFI